MKFVKALIAVGLFSCLTSCGNSAPVGVESEVDSESTLTSLILRDNVWTLGKWTGSGTVGVARQSISNTPSTSTGCPVYTVNPIPVKRYYDLSILVLIDDDSEGPSQICIPQWSIDLEVYPGTTYSADIDLEDLRDSPDQICGSCLDENGNVVSNTTIVFEMQDTQD